MISWSALVLLMIPLSGITFYFAWQRIRQFRNDERNPYRRYCKACGQQQDVVEQGWSVWWEPIGNIKDHHCKCHSFARKCD